MSDNIEGYLVLVFQKNGDFDCILDGLNKTTQEAHERIRKEKEADKLKKMNYTYKVSYWFSNPASS